MNTGEVFRGKLIEAEDNMNCQMSNITVAYRDGRVAQLEQVYIHGSKIRFLILPDVLKNAPMLKSMKNKPKAQGRSGKGCYSEGPRGRKRERTWKHLPEAKINLSVIWVRGYMRSLLVKASYLLWESEEFLFFHAYISNEDYES
eukprot:bmy_07006T0